MHLLVNLVIFMIKIELDQIKERYKLLYVAVATFIHVKDLPDLLLDLLLE